MHSAWLCSKNMYNQMFLLLFYVLSSLNQCSCIIYCVNPPHRKAVISILKNSMARCSYCKKPCRLNMAFNGKMLQELKTREQRVYSVPISKAQISCGGEYNCQAKCSFIASDKGEFVACLRQRRRWWWSNYTNTS